MTTTPTDLTPTMHAGLAAAADGYAVGSRTTEAALKRRGLVIDATAFPYIKATPLGLRTLGRSGAAVVAEWECWRDADPQAADAFADEMRGELEDAHARPHDDHAGTLQALYRAMEGTAPEEHAIAWALHVDGALLEREQVERWQAGKLRARAMQVLDQAPAAHGQPSGCALYDDPAAACAAAATLALLGAGERLLVTVVLWVES